tara:strand:+ start:180 stop:521 length:342 start_codon:yes stop_codon:yes gene_type:complete
MASKKAHCIDDIDAIHPICGGQGVVMRGAKTVVIHGVGVRNAIRGKNSAHAAEPKPPCAPHVGFPMVSDVSKTVFAEGRGICREFDSISDATSNAPCTSALGSIMNSSVFVGG